MPNPNDKINKLLKEADKLFENSFLSTEDYILKTYAKALKEITNKLANITAEGIAAERLKIRLKSLEAQITAIIGKMQKVELNSISFNIKDSLLLSFENTALAISTGAGIDLMFTKVPKESIDFILTYNRWADKIKNNNAILLTDTLSESEKYLRSNASQEIAMGLAEGKSYTQVKKALQERFGITAGRAKAITYDQMHAGHMAGRDAGIQEAAKAATRLGLEYEEIWQHNNIGKPRPDHVRMGDPDYPGHVADKDGVFTLPDGTKTRAPGLTGNPKHDINCFPGFVNVLSPSNIEKIYRREYEGDLIEITTAAGIKLTGTPKHPIMTEKGFIALDSLNEGDNVFNTSFARNRFFIKPNINNTISKFSEVFDFAKIRFSCVGVDGIEGDFHGDGMAKNVDIIFADSFLGNTFKTIFSKPISEFNFALTNVMGMIFNCHRSFMKFFFSNFSVFVRFVRFVSLLPPLFFCHQSPFKKFRFSSVASLNIVFDENSFNNLTANSKLNSNFVFRNPRQISFNDFGCIDFFKRFWYRISSLHCLRMTTFRNFISNKKLDKRCLTNPIDLGEFFLSNPGVIDVDKIVNINRFKYFGHVYNLQTKDNYYLVNDPNIRKDNGNSKYIIAHNCHCSKLFNIKGL
jgi:hypothetical protein